MLKRAVSLGVVGLMLAFCTPAWASIHIFDLGGPDETPVNDSPGSEQNILEIYNHLFPTPLDPDYDWDYLDTKFYSPDQDWHDGTVLVGAQARFAGYTQTFGYFTDLGTGNNRTELFQVSGSGYSVSGSGSFTIDTVFAWYRGGTGTAWYSEDDVNSDNANHMVALKSPDEDTILLFWEDTAKPSWDQDYDDLVVEIEGASGGARIPEPSSMLLVLTGLAGLAYWKKRK